MFKNLPKVLVKSLMAISYSAPTKYLVKRVLYLWKECFLIVKVKPIIEHFEVEVTTKNKTILKAVKIKSIHELKKILDKVEKNVQITKEDIDNNG